MEIKEATIGFVQRPKWSLWRQLGFGTCHASFDEDEHSEMAEACLTAGAYCYIDWKDRLRLLVSGKLMVDIAIKTDVIVRKSIAKSNISILPPTWRIGIDH